MEQTPLFHEDLSAAFVHLVSSMGGPKAVGISMWPAMKCPEKAGRKLSDCLNNNHQQKLSPDEVVWLLCEGRKAGIHSAMAYINSEAGYAPPLPVEPEDEAAQLQKEFIAAVKTQSEMLKRMERLNLPSMRSVS